MSKTLYQKVFDAHVVREVEGKPLSSTSTVIWCMK
jgi:hypothetical protein